VTNAELKFYDRAGKQIEGGVLAWAHMLEDPVQRIVAVDTDMVDEEHGRMVSTIWNGLPARMSQNWENPLIFETAFMENGHIEEVYASSSEALALEQHRDACRLYLGRDPRPEDGFRDRIIEQETGNAASR
jgi:hypothetical protein